MSQPISRAAVIVATFGLLINNLAWPCPITPEAAPGSSLVAIEIVFPLFFSGSNESAAPPPTPVTVWEGIAPSAISLPANFFDFNFDTVVGKSSVGR